MYRLLLPVVTLVVASCGSAREAPPTASTPAASTTSQACPTVTATTAPPEPVDSRLQRPWFTPSYSAASDALASFRMDPADSSVEPALTRQQTADLGRRSLGTPATADERHLAVRFGLFTGNQAIVGDDANHTLRGSRIVSGVPAWIVAVSGVSEGTNHGGAVPPPGVSTSVPCPLAITAVVVIRDSDGRELASQSGTGYQALD